MPEPQRRENRPQIADCALIFAVVIASALPYLFGLGFYTDDWCYIAALEHSSSQGMGAMFRELASTDPNLLTRPVDTACFVLGYKLFGQHPTPYHVITAVVLGLMAVLCYLALRELRIGRWPAFLIALIFGLLPDYSTDRFLVSSHQNALCMAFAMLGIYALLRAVRAEEQHPTKWVCLAVPALVLSILSYEAAIGLILAGLGIAGWRRTMGIRGSSKLSLAKLGGIATTAAAVLAVWMVKARMQTNVGYHHHFLALLGGRSWHAIVQAVLFNFWTYGLHMPSVLMRLYRDSALSLAAMSVAAVIALVVAAYLWRHMEPSAIPSRLACLQLIAAGLVVFGLGYALFFTGSPNFISPGLDSRLAIASAPGAACVLVAIAGLACSVVRNNTLRGRAFGIVIAVICGVNSLAVSGIGFFWVNAASQQRAILSSLAAHVHSLPHGSVLLLDGFCPWYGPSWVFVYSWETAAAIRLTLHDDSLSGDVVPADLPHDAAEVVSFSPPQARVYPYSNYLFVYDIPRQTLTNLPSAEAANAFSRAMTPAGDSGCHGIKGKDSTELF